MSESSYPAVGEAAPDFRLPTIGGAYESETEVSLSDFAGNRLLLYFYPKDNTPGCTAQACAIRDSWDSLKDRLQIVGVSPDSVRKHQNFINKFDLPFPLLVDAEQEMSKAYGVWVKKKMYGKEYMGVERSSFLIDTDGTLLHVFPKVKPAEHIALVEEQLEALPS